MKHFHPRKNNKGQPVELFHPSQATNLAAWGQAEELATVAPQGPMPDQVNHLEIASWSDAPRNASGWEQLARASNFAEPLMEAVVGKPAASGAVVIEPDGRIWVVSPSNGFGGYTHTFPKGKLDKENGLSLRANALNEVFEESGLKVQLTGFLCDSVRTTSVTRFYLAMRVGGNPADMGWESQAAHLLPMDQLPAFVSHDSDKIVVQSLRALPRLSKSDIVSYQWGLTSVHRILATLAGFRRHYGYWPIRLLLDRDMLEVIPKEVLTPLGWKILNQRLEIVPIEAGDMYAEGSEGERFEYNAEHFHLHEGPSVCFWIWGVELVDR